MSPKYLRLFSYKEGKTAKDILSDYIAGNSGISFKEYEIISNEIPNKIRRSSLHDIHGTETSVVDINEISDIIYREVTSEDVVSKILYTNYEDSNDYKNNLAYLRFNNGHCEIVLFVDQAIDVSKDDRVILVTLEDENHNIIVATAEITEDYDKDIESSYMASSSNKVIRILIQKGSNETSYNITPYKNLFNDVDLGILELTTIFDKRISAKWNSFEIFNFLDKFQLGPLDKSKTSNNKLIQYYNNEIAELTEIVNILP